MRKMIFSSQLLPLRFLCIGRVELITQMTASVYIYKYGHMYYLSGPLLPLALPSFSLGKLVPSSLKKENVNSGPPPSYLSPRQQLTCFWRARWSSASIKTLSGSSRLAWRCLRDLALTTTGHGLLLTKAGLSHQAVWKGLNRWEGDGAAGAVRFPLGMVIPS